MIERKLYKLDQEEYPDTESKEINSFSKVDYVDIHNNVTNSASSKNTTWKEPKYTYNQEDDVIWDEDYWDDYF
jgi:hypothetical protein